LAPVSAAAAPGGSQRLSQGCGSASSLSWSGEKLGGDVIPYRVLSHFRGDGGVSARGLQTPGGLRAVSDLDKMTWTSGSVLSREMLIEGEEEPREWL